MGPRLLSGAHLFFCTVHGNAPVHRHETRRRPSHRELYGDFGKDMVREALHGYNGTIFAYGQSGSGKTFSMLGPETVIETIKSGQ